MYLNDQVNKVATGGFGLTLTWDVFKSKDKE